MRFTGPLHQGNVISLLGLGPGQVSSCCKQCVCMCVCKYVCVCVGPCVDTVMDDEDEQINTKGLSLWLHPNLPQHVCSVSQQAETEEGRDREEIMIIGECMGNGEVRKQMKRRRGGERLMGRRRSIGRGYAGRD